MKTYTVTVPAYGKQPGESVSVDPNDTLVQLNVAAGVLVEGKRIERVGPSEYRIEGGRFTSCMQPNPRWSFTASSASPRIASRTFE